LDLENDVAEFKIKLCAEIDVVLEHGHGEIVIKIDDKRILWKSSKEYLEKLMA
jgi:hypothetical protein